MSSSGTSDFSNETASGVAAASSILVEDGVLGLDDDKFLGPPTKQRWYERRSAQYTFITVLILAIVALVIGGLWVGNRAGEPSSMEGGNQSYTALTSTLAPTLAPTSALTAAPITATPPQSSSGVTSTLAPTLAPTSALTAAPTTPTPPTASGVTSTLTPFLAPTSALTAAPTTLTPPTASDVTSTLSPSLAQISGLTASPTSPAPPTAFERTDPLAFYVMGDVPYDLYEEEILRNQITAMTINLHTGASFLVHVGDIMKALQTECALGFYTSVRNMLSLAPVPTFVLAGDNDILDCPSTETAWGHYQDHFVDFEQEWASEARNAGAAYLDVSKVERNANNPEMFSFIEDRILFLSVNLMNLPLGGYEDDGFVARLATSKAWVTKQLDEKFHQNVIRGVVMFGHAFITGDVKRFFVDIRNVFTQAQVTVPVLYMHGDGHTFSINYNFAINYRWGNFTAIQVEQGALADPLLVTVAIEKNGIMDPLVAENDMQIIFGNGLFRIDRQGGCYNGVDC